MSNGNITENGFYENGSPSPPPPPPVKTSESTSEIPNNQLSAQSLPSPKLPNLPAETPNCSLSDVKLENLEESLSLEASSKKPSYSEVDRMKNDSVMVKKDTIVSLEGGCGDSKRTITSEVKTGISLDFVTVYV